MSLFVISEYRYGRDARGGTEYVIYNWGVVGSGYFCEKIADV